MEPEITQTTKDRLLEAAGEVFAEKGFREATVRDICARAGANLAAINYHYRDKESLYAAVFEHARMYDRDLYPLESFRGGDTPEDRLAAFIRQFCLRLFDKGRPNWHVKLMTREMVEPTGELDTIVERGIRPKFELLSTIISDLIGLPAEHETTALCAASVIGQCLHHHHCREVFFRLRPGMQGSDTFLDDLTAHVTRFSIGAVRHIQSELAARSAGPAGSIVQSE